MDRDVEKDVEERAVQEEGGRESSEVQADRMPPLLTSELLEKNAREIARGFRRLADDISGRGWESLQSRIDGLGLKEVEISEVREALGVGEEIEEIDEEARRLAREAEAALAQEIGRESGERLEAKSELAAELDEAMEAVREGNHARVIERFLSDEGAGLAAGAGGVNIIERKGLGLPLRTDMFTGDVQIVIDREEMTKPGNAALASAMIVEQLAGMLRGHDLRGDNLSQGVLDLGQDIEGVIDVAAYLKESGLFDEEILSRLGFMKMYENARRSKEATMKQLTDIFPGKRFEMLSYMGSSADILVDLDEPGAVYKVGMRKGDQSPQPDELDDYEFPERQKENLANEARKLKSLGEAGISARLLEYIPSKRKGEVADGDKDSRLPIIKMERIDFEPDGLIGLPEERRREEADRITAVLEELAMVPLDVEFVYDSKNDRIVAVDVGGMHELTEEDQENGYYDIRSEVLGHLGLK